MGRYINVIDKINTAAKFLIGTFTAVALVVMFWEIISRAYFNVSLSWANELVRYLLVWITFLGAGIAIRYSKLIRLDFLVNMMSSSKRIVFIMRSLANVLTIIFSLIILKYSWVILEVVHLQKSSTMQIPMSIPYSAIPLGSLLMILNVIVIWLEGEPQNEDEELI